MDDEATFYLTELGVRSDVTSTAVTGTHAAENVLQHSAFNYNQCLINKDESWEIFSMSATSDNRGFPFE